MPETRRLEKYFIISKNIKKTAFNSIKANSLEALIAAIYLDSNFSNAYEIVKKLWNNYLKKINEKCRIISDDINAISLLENFNKVYTRTSQMGFEALIMGCKCVVFGMPFYGGWGLTDDRVSCSRRKRKLSLSEVLLLL